MTEMKDDLLNVMIRSDTKSGDEIAEAETDDDETYDCNDEDEAECADGADGYTEPEAVHAPQRNVRPAVYAVLTVFAVILSFFIGSLIGKDTKEPEPVMTAEPISETATPEPTSEPEVSATPSAEPEKEEESEEVSETSEGETEDEQEDDETGEEKEEDKANAEPEDTPEPNASSTPDPAIYNGMAPLIGGGKTPSSAVTIAPTPTPSQPDDTAVNAAASRLMANHAGMSRAELMRGLISSGYTSEQADRAADHMAVSWKQQAIYRAMSVYDRDTYTGDRLIVELVMAGFSQSDAQAAADAVGA